MSTNLGGQEQESEPRTCSKCGSYDMLFVFRSREPDLQARDEKICPDCKKKEDNQSWQ